MGISILVPEKHAGDEITYQSHVHSQIVCFRDIKKPFEGLTLIKMQIWMMPLTSGLGTCMQYNYVFLPAYELP